MVALLTILIIIACIVLGFFILVQNPKGGGLTGTFGSIGSQVMGVKKSTDVMEKGTWVSMGIVALLCIISVAYYDSPENTTRQRNTAPVQQEQPVQNQPAPAAPAN